MILSALLSPKLGTLQNGLAATVFFLLFAAQGAAYLLYLYPGTELFWALSVPLNRLASPVLYSFDAWLDLAPFAAIGLLGAAAAFPLLAQRTRSWLGTACAGHVALGICIVLAAGAFRRAETRQASADLGQVFETVAFDGTSLAFAFASVLFAGLCLTNHLAFVGRMRRATPPALS